MNSWDSVDGHKIPISKQDQNKHHITQFLKILVLFISSLLQFYSLAKTKKQILMYFYFTLYLVLLCHAKQVIRNPNYTVTVPGHSWILYFLWQGLGQNSKQKTDKLADLNGLISLYSLLY